jgi:undecaprenyl-diphosphatase
MDTLNRESIAMSRWKQKIREFSPRSLRRMLWLAVAALALGLFFEITLELHEKDGELLAFDRLLLALFADLRVNRLNGPAVDLTALGSITVISILTAVAAMILFFVKDRLGLLYLLTATIGAGLWTKALKSFISRDRPTEVAKLVDVVGYSYPSGHSLGAAAFFLTIAIIGGRYFESSVHRAILLAAAALLAGSVGLSRIYLGVHYPSDALSGFLFGATWSLTLAHFLTRKVPASFLQSSSG